MSTQADIPIVRADTAAWNDASLRHGFLGRKGGASGGPFESLNLSYSVGDDESAVDINWDRVRARFPELARISRLNQVHGNTIHAVTSDSIETRPAADGMVTADAGIMLAVLSADCVPVLMIDPEHRIAGALHAGWRGVLAGIAQHGLHAMTSLGADLAGIHAALGPAIGQCCFEVDANLADRFSREVEGAARHRRAGIGGKAYLDLRAIVRDQLERAGVAPGNVTVAGPCTRCESQSFFSRRAAAGASTGLQMSYVGLAG